MLGSEARSKPYCCCLGSEAALLLGSDAALLLAAGLG
jgi:hypothetical protein